MRFPVHSPKMQKLTFYHAALLLCACVFAVCAGILFYHLVILPKRSDDGMAAARSLYRSPTGGTSAQNSDTPASSASSTQNVLSFSQLKAINPDVDGWVTIPGTGIDYPVLRAPVSSPDYYLTHDWMRGVTKYGSICLYPQSSKTAAKRKNTILYGHSMKDGRMFSPLLQYDNPAFYRAHPIIMYQDSTSKTYWKIFAVIKINTDPSQGIPFDYQKTSFTSTENFLKYLYEVRIRSILNTPVNLKSSDEILTLSTCSYEFDGFRTAVFARRVRAGENTDVDTAKAAKNSQALYPDCWYKKFGGGKPSLPNFQEAVKSGGLSLS